MVWGTPNFDFSHLPQHFLIIDRSKTFPGYALLLNSGTPFYSLSEISNQGATYLTLTTIKYHYRTYVTLTTHHNILMLPQNNNLISSDLVIDVRN